MMGFWECSGISWTTHKQSAPCSRQTTTTTPHRSIFTGWMLFLTIKNNVKALKVRNSKKSKLLTDNKNNHRFTAITQVNLR